MSTEPKSAYLAGPMRGLPRFNFDAFDAAALDLRQRGWAIISPADIDRENGFDPDKHEEGFTHVNDLIARDIKAVCDTESTILLPGWEKSVGANAEVAVARWAEKEILLYPDLIPLEEEDILHEALRITRGDRQNQYGPPEQDFKRVASMWSALKGVEFCARDVAMFMICLKLSRESHQVKRDNAVDLAGYARCLALCQLAERERRDAS